MLTFKKSNNLSPLDLKIISYIEENHEKVIFMRIRDLANKTYTSPATVLRCIKKLGYNSFPEFRLQLQQELEDPEYQKEKLPYSICFQNSFENDLDSLVTLIKQSDIIYCLGVGNSKLMAAYAANLLATIGYKSFNTDPTISSYSLNNKKNNEESKDVCLIFSASGESLEIVKLASELKNTPISTISISSQPYNSLSHHTNQHFYYNSSIERTSYNLDLSSQLPVVYFIETLIQSLK